MSGWAAAERSALLPPPSAWDPGPVVDVLALDVQPVGQQHRGAVLDEVPREVRHERAAEVVAVPPGVAVGVAGGRPDHEGRVADDEVEPLAQRITRAASGEVFRADTEEFAVDYLDRLTGDYELFREDLQRGAFGW